LNTDWIARFAEKSEKIVVMEDARQRSFDGGAAQRDQGANVVLTIDEKFNTSPNGNWQRPLRRPTRLPEP